MHIYNYYTCIHVAIYSVIVQQRRCSGILLFVFADKCNMGKGHLDTNNNIHVFVSETSLPLIHF